MSEVVLFSDAKTQQKKGGAFVRYPSYQHAQWAVQSLDGYVFEGSPRPITVSIAQSQDGGSAAGGGGCQPSPPATKRPSSAMTALDIQELTYGLKAGVPPPPAPGTEGVKLFVGQLPFSRSEDDIKEVFNQYGPVAEVLLHRDAQGQKKGGAFVRFMSSEHAAKALELDVFVFQGSTRAITVSMAGDGGMHKRPRIA